MRTGRFVCIQALFNELTTLRRRRSERKQSADASFLMQGITFTCMAARRGRSASSLRSDSAAGDGEEWTRSSAG